MKKTTTRGVVRRGLAVLVGLALGTVSSGLRLDPRRDAREPHDRAPTEAPSVGTRALAYADLGSTRDHLRALALLADEDPTRRFAAATWLRAHGPADVVVPALLAALPNETSPLVQPILAEALAVRARPSDAAALVELVARLRPPAREFVMLALASLATEESDAWLIERVTATGDTPIRVQRARSDASGVRPAVPLTTQVVLHPSTLVRRRREQLVPRLLEALAAERSEPLLALVGALSDPRARPILIELLGDRVLHRSALDALAALGPDEATARALVPFVAEASDPALQAAYVRAAVSANPRVAERAAWLEDAALRPLVLASLVLFAPDEARAVLGDDPAAWADRDREALRAALTRPSAALAPWLRAAARRSVDALDEDDVRDARAAWLAVGDCATPPAPIDDALLASDPELALVEAQRARACRRSLPLASTLDAATRLLLRALAGESVEGELAAAFSTSSAPLDLAHAWLVAAEPGEGLLDALRATTDDDVRDVLVLAAVTHGLDLGHALGDDLLVRWSESEASRAAALHAIASTARPSPALAAIERRATSDLDPIVRQTALASRARRTGSTATLCTELEQVDAGRRTAAARLLATHTPTPSCLLAHARVEPSLLAVLDARREAALASQPDARPEQPTRVALVLPPSPTGRPFPRVALATDEGRAFRLRPTSRGWLVTPELRGGVDAEVVLEPHVDALRALDARR